MNERFNEEECEKEFKKWYEAHGSVGYGPMERHPFKAAWDHQQERIQALEEVLKMLSNGMCWCDFAIGHPLMKDHSNLCKLAKDALSQQDKQGGVV